MQCKHVVTSNANAWSVQTQLGGQVRCNFPVILGFANPYAWLDTVVLIGSIGATKPAGQQALFATGAMTASLVWFVVLALCCQRLTVLFRKPAVWRWLDAGVAVLMVYLAVTLITDSLHIFQIAL